jgi:arabinose-5-phosphate isomerase
MQYKKFGKFDFKKIHPAGNLGAQLKTVEDIMLTGNKIPFVNENLNMRSAIKILSNKKLGFLIVRNQRGKITGVISDGDIRRHNEKKLNLNEINVTKIMTKNPISIDKDSLAAKGLALMNEKRITSLCVHDKKNKHKIIGVIHIHSILQSNIT